MNHVHQANKKRDNRECHYCNKKGHVAAECKKKAKDQGAAKTDHTTLASLGYSGLDADDWVVDSGASVHLVRAKGMLESIVTCDEGCRLPDGSRMKVTHRGNVTLPVTVDGRRTTVTLRNVCYSPTLAVNLISLGSLMEIGCELTVKNAKHALVKDDRVLWYVVIKNHVLVVDQRDDSHRDATDIGALIIHAADESPLSAPEPVRATLYELHVRFAHLSYDTIVCLAADAANRLEITDRSRPVCRPCSEGKTTKAPQPKEDSGASAAIEVVGAVLNTDLKGPITPRDRRGNRFMVNFIEHRSNYCRAFVAKTKDQAARMFEEFLLQFEKEFNVRVHVLRSDGGGEYMNIDLFCRTQGIKRQITERDNQAANGKAERMHRTIMNIVHCMLFGSKLPLTFWGDAVEYAAYVLNRMPTRANKDRKSPLEVLTGKPPLLADIVAFGSPCTVYRNP